MQVLDVDRERAKSLGVPVDAFATLGEMLKLGGHLLAPDGIWIALKGQLSKDEILGVPPGFVVAEVKALHVPGLGAARQAAIIKRTNTQERAA